jgi:hypothetical protein
MCDRRLAGVASGASSTPTSSTYRWTFARARSVGDATTTTISSGMRAYVQLARSVDDRTDQGAQVIAPVTANLLLLDLTGDGRRELAVASQNALAK